MTQKTEFYKHIHYLDCIEKWIKYRDLYEGDHDTLIHSDYLWYHEFEHDTRDKAGDKLRSIRETRTQYTNLLESFIQRYISLIFKKDVNINNLDKLIGKEQLKDIDGNGTSLVKFVKEYIAKPYFLYGKYAVLADSYNINSLSRNDEIESGKRPFLEPIDIFSLMDWDLETEGARKNKFNWLRLEYKKILPRLSPTEKQQIVRESKVLKSLTLSGNYEVEIYRTEDESKGWELQGIPIVTDLDEIPVVVGKTENGSWIKNVAPLALARFNLISSLDNQLHFQAHQRLTVSGATGQSAKEAAIVLSAANVAMLPNGATINVIEPSNPVALKERIAMVTSDMFRVAFKQTRSIPEDSRAVQGAETIREAKEEFLEAAIEAAKDIEDGARRAIRAYLQFTDQEDAEFDFSLDKDITIEDINEMISSAQAFMDRINRYPLWSKSLDKKVAEQMNFTNIDEIKEEIENTKQEQRLTRPGLAARLANGER